MAEETDRDERRLMGSLDRATGQTYFPPRPLAADGSLRATEPLPLSRKGVLYSWTVLGGTHYGQVDLPEGVRIQCMLAESDHRIDADYELEFTGEGDDEWRFRRA